jgi:hypothetical protein
MTYSIVNPTAAPRREPTTLYRDTPAWYAFVEQVRREVLLELAAEFRDEDTDLAQDAFLGGVTGCFEISKALERRAAGR